MTKTDLINRLAEELKMTKTQAGKAVDSILKEMKETLANGEDVQLIGFGSFSTARRAERTGRNPRTGASITIPAKTVPTFRAGKALKDALN
ncbi:HU family DNA-binding protein [bacterium]|nr:HU family DNA-binding protein [bacterium]